MAIFNRSNLLPMIILIITTIAAATETSPPHSQPLQIPTKTFPPTQSPPPAATTTTTASSPPPRPSPETETATQDQIDRIIDALIGAGDFGSWAGVISSAVLPLSSTLFVPENDAVSGSSAAAGDPFMMPYHVVPQRLTFPELLQFNTRARLPTLLPGKSLVVTNSSRNNFTIDGSRITMPDLYSTATFTVHGVSAVFDYSLYGDGIGPVPAPPAPVVVPADQSEMEEPLLPVEDLGGVVSGAVCNEIPAVFFAFFVSLGFKIHYWIR